MTRALVDQVLSLPAEERLELLDRIRESLVRNPDMVPVPQEHREILDARLKAWQANPGDVISWESVRERYLGRE